MKDSRGSSRGGISITLSTVGKAGGDTGGSEEEEEEEEEAEKEELGFTSAAILPKSGNVDDEGTLDDGGVWSSNILSGSFP